jgi:predicted XRE-type DNA-binding protein
MHPKCQLMLSIWVYGLSEACVGPSYLCEEFVKYLNARKLTQRTLAEQFGIDEALVSKIIHYSFNELMTDRLIKYLSVLYPEVKVTIRVA